jgi:ABC-type transport system involved in cytochrome bd biosynthesis fused ATPase/permease subunit
VAPREVQISFWLWIFVAVLQAITGLLSLTGRDAAINALRDANTGLTEDQLQTAVTATLALYTLIGFVIAGLFVWFAIKARAGRNWARIALMILGVVVLIFQIFGLTLLGIVTALAIIGGIVTLNLRPSSLFFASNRTG